MLERMARPLRGLSNGIAGVTDGIYRVLGGPGRLLQDFLNGSWLGHSLHAVLVDVVIGAATAALLLDVLRVFFSVEGLETATTWVLGLAWLSALGAILSGLTDYKDTAPNSAERDVAGLHGARQHRRHHRLRDLAAPTPGRRARRCLLDPADRLPRGQRRRLHRRPRRLQVRLHGQSQRLQSRQAREGLHRGRRRRRGARWNAHQDHVRHHRRWCWSGAATWFTPSRRRARTPAGRSRRASSRATRSPARGISRRSGWPTARWCTGRPARARCRIGLGSTAARWSCRARTTDAEPQRRPFRAASARLAFPRLNRSPLRVRGAA